MKFYGFDTIAELTEHAGRTEWNIDADSETVSIEGIGTFHFGEYEFYYEMNNEPRCVGGDGCSTHWAPGYIDYIDMSIWIPINEVCRVKLTRHKEVWRETGEVIG